MVILQLEERKAENEARCEAHRERIQRLWDRLQVSQEEREAFNKHMVSSRKRNLDAVRSFSQDFLFFLLFVTSCDGQYWGSCFDSLFHPQLQTEVQRLEELKLLNIRNVTDAIRSEIAVFWEKCFFSVDQRQVFTPYFSGGFSCLTCLS